MSDIFKNEDLESRNLILQAVDGAARMAEIKDSMEELKEYSISFAQAKVDHNPIPVKNIYQRIVAIMGDVKYVEKDGMNASQKYPFVSHEAVSDAIHDALVKHGVAIISSIKTCIQNGNRLEMIMTVKFVNVDNPCDFIEIESLGHGIDSQDKAPGKAMSYAIKYAILKTFCLPAGDKWDNVEDKDEPHRKAPDDDYINEAQLLELQSRISDNEVLLRKMFEKYKIKELSLLPIGKYHDALNSIHNFWEIKKTKSQDKPKDADWI